MYFLVLILFFKTVTEKGAYPDSYTIHRKLAKDITISLPLISAAPNEILTYLGQHIYSGHWKKDPMYGYTKDMEEEE